MDRLRRGGLGAINGCGGDELGNVGAFRLKRRGVAELSGVGIGIESCKRGDFVRFFLLEGRFFGPNPGSIVVLSDGAARGITVVLLDDVARGITVVSFDELFGASSSAEFEP